MKNGYGVATTLPAYPFLLVGKGVGPLKSLIRKVR